MKKLDLLENKFTSIFAITILVLIDQITKYYTRLHLKGETVVVIENFFQFTYVENRGAAFGLMQGMQFVFAILSIFIIIALIFFYREQKKKNLNGLGMLSWILIFVISGAIGNLIDRLLFGFVTDMIDVSGIWKFVFNVADMYVVCGFIALAIYMVLFDIERKI